MFGGKQVKAKKHRERMTQDENTIVWDGLRGLFLEHAGENQQDCRSQYFAAELYIHRQHSYPGFDQFLWLFGYCRLFGGG